MKIRNKKWKQYFKTTIKRNTAIQGDSIETMILKIKNGEGTEAISDRDLVYNDNEVDTVNPVTNIRSDKMELMLEEKIGEYEHKAKKGKTPKPKEKEGEEPTPEE